MDPAGSTEQERQSDWPEPCPKCLVEAKLRKWCDRCQKGVFVIEHSGNHYMGGATHEVIPCGCIEQNKWQRAQASKAKKKAKAVAGGKVFRPKRRHVTTPEMARKAAEGLAQGLTYRGALKQAGFPEAALKNASKGVKRMVGAQLKDLGQRYIAMARGLTPEDQELIVRGKLLDNILTNSDKGVMSAKQLGADKRVSMWTPDSQVGMVILQAPPIPKIDHEVPLFPVEHLLNHEGTVESHKAKTTQHTHEDEEEGPAEETPFDEPETTEPEEYEEEERTHDPER